MSREDNVYFAKLAEQAERYDDMVKHMKDIVSVLHYINNNRLMLNSATKTGIFLALPIKIGLDPEGQHGEQ